MDRSNFGLPSSVKFSPGERLIFVNRYYYPDVSATAQILTDLVGSLDAADHDVHIITSRQLYGQARARLPRSEVIERVTIHRAWSTRFGRKRLVGRLLDYGTFYLTAVVFLLGLARRGDVIVVMTDPPMLSVFGALIAKIRGARVVNWLQDIFPEVSVELKMLRGPGWLIRTLHRARDWSLRAAECNVVIGERMREHIVGLSVNARRVRVIENWAVEGRSEPVSVEQSLLRRAVAADARFIVEYSGNLGYAHDYVAILRAARELSSESGWLFLMIGGGVGMSLLEAAARAEGLTNIRFLPYREREMLGDSMAAGNVHLCCLQPSLEGLIVPSKFYGILAAGRPMVMIGDTDGEHARILRREDCGRVVSCGDGVTLARELRRMRGDSEWCRAAGRRARELFERRYTLRQATRKWSTVLREIGSPAGAYELAVEAPVGYEELAEEP